jgi:hypothetical protein
MTHHHGPPSECHADPSELATWLMTWGIVLAIAVLFALSCAHAQPAGHPQWAVSVTLADSSNYLFWCESKKDAERKCAEWRRTHRLRAWITREERMR